MQMTIIKTTGICVWVVWFLFTLVTSICLEVEWLLFLKLFMDVSLYRWRMHHICKRIHFITFDGISSQQQWIGRFYCMRMCAANWSHCAEFENESLTMWLLCLVLYCDFYWIISMYVIAIFLHAIRLAEDEHLKPNMVFEKNCLIYFKCLWRLLIW